jgi:WD40 repeat protein
LFLVIDIRVGRAVNVLAGHEYGVRRVRTSPHAGNIVASCGYDFSTRLWDLSLPPGHQQVNNCYTLNLKKGNDNILPTLCAPRLPSSTTTASLSWASILIYMYRDNWPTVRGMSDFACDSYPCSRKIFYY